MGENSRITSLNMRSTGKQAEQQVRNYLMANESRLKSQTPECIFSEVRRNVLSANRNVLPDFELRQIIAGWRVIVKAPTAPPKVPPARTPAENELIAKVKKAVSTVIDGVDLTYGAGRLNISVSGATAELKKGSARASASVGWSGALTAETQVGDFLFSGSLSAEKWEIRLSYPRDTVVPDLSKVGKVFGEGEAAMREILTATSGYRSLNDIPRIKDLVTPHLDPVKRSVTAAKNIAKAPKVSFDISVGSPDPLPGDTGRRGGWQAQAVFTVRF